jgi:hypothetical protein
MNPSAADINVSLTDLSTLENNLIEILGASILLHNVKIPVTLQLF